jgi:AAA+ ATPase superfamily predicted ATPase
MSNLCNYSGPITDPDLFIGRTNIINKIYSRIGAGRPQSVSLVGENKIGKTSLLNYIRNKNIQKKYFSNHENYVCIFFPVQDNSKSVDVFINNLCSAISAETGMNYIYQSVSQCYYWFKDVVESLTKFDKKLILLMDDFNLVTQNSDFPLEFFSFLRSMANNFNVAYVTTSYHDLQQLCVSKDIEESPFFNIFTNISLKAFDQDELNEFINKMSVNGYEWFREYSKLILEYTGNFPYLLQSAGSLLFDLGQKYNDKLILEKKFREHIIFHMQEQFLQIWDHLYEHQQRILVTLAKSKKPNPAKQYLIRELERKQLIYYTKRKYHFFSPAFREFIINKKHLKTPILLRLKKIFLN